MLTHKGKAQLEQLRSFPVYIYHRGTQRETAVLDACILLDDDALHELASSASPAGLALARAKPLVERSYRLREAYQDERREKLALLDKGFAYYALAYALREELGWGEEIAPMIRRMTGDLRWALHTIVMGSGQEPPIYALAALTRMSLLYPDDAPTALGYEVWAGMQPGSRLEK